MATDATTVSVMAATTGHNPENDPDEWETVTERPATYAADYAARLRRWPTLPGDPF